MQDLFTPFSEIIAESELPQKFTFPFYYTPHPLALRAAKEVMHCLENEKITSHNFGLEAGKEKGAIGKMFGVLVVKNKNGAIGYLKAFSGKINDSNYLEGFVPPIFDMLAPDGFYRKGEEELNAMNRAIEKMEEDSSFLLLKKEWESLKIQAASEISNFKNCLKSEKQNRATIRKELETDNPADTATLLENLVKESMHQQYELKCLQREWKEKLEALENEIKAWEEKIFTQKNIRKNKSAALQNRLFEQYNFLNIHQEKINVRHIFETTPLQKPPAGAGECATPKLLQYAFQNQMQPLAMAEFWWGQSPVSEIRKHKEFYPACRGKCEPILGYMLQDIPMDKNPMLELQNLEQNISIIYEDEHLVVVNKPAEMLSVPGIHIQDSVLSFLQKKYPNATGPLLVHRLDMSTSGILLAAKTKEAHQNLQAQFIKKTVKKRYVALLEGVLKENAGTISLPLRVDLDNRPHQLVCYEYGKMAVTHWEVIERIENRTKVHFYPITGRTHQLRVHAAHPLGLNVAILGDDLYGNRSDRLYLHADFLEIKHPQSKQRISFHAPAPF